MLKLYMCTWQRELFEWDVLSFKHCSQLYPYYNKCIVNYMKIEGIEVHFFLLFQNV